MMKRSYYTAEVDIDYAEILADLDDDDLLEELRKRKVDTAVDVMQIYEAMLLNSRDRSWELMRQYVQEMTGRVLP